MLNYNFTINARKKKITWQVYAYDKWNACDKQMQLGFFFNFSSKSLIVNCITKIWICSTKCVHVAVQITRAKKKFQQVLRQNISFDSILVSISYLCMQFVK